MNDTTHKPSNKAFKIPEGNVWDSAWKMTAAVAAIGVVVALAGAFLQTERFAFSYLYGFVTVMTLWLGSIFFILIQHLTGAGWSVTVRRTSEFFASGVVVLPFLFLPILPNLETLYPWWNLGHEEAGEHHSQRVAPEDGVAHAQERGGTDHVKPGTHDDTHVRRGSADDPENAAKSAAMHGDPSHPGHAESGPAAHGGAHDAHHQIEHAIMLTKTWYLNHAFFFIRMIAYFAIWLWIGLTLFKKSVAQDATGDKQLTAQLQRFSAPAVFLFALSLTFAGFDWIMSLEPLWYSTMFGVRVFASSAVTSFAAIIIVTLGWKRAGLVGDAINTEHYHDLGKLMFGFLIFWGYISFSEFFLIWYAAIPEETIYYHRRWDENSWRMISVGIVVLKFIVPFYLVMSRNAKRNNAMIGFGASWLLVMHLVEMYYWIMPSYRPFKPVQWGGIWMEAGCVMATLGIYLTVVFWRMRKHSLIPVGDPRLERSLHFVQV